MRGNGFAGIAGTAWVEAAMLAYEGTEAPLVHVNDENKDVLHDSLLAAADLLHRRANCRGRSLL